MCCCNHIGACFVHCCVQYVCGAVDTVLSVDNLALVVDKDQIGNCHVAKRQTKWVHPEVIWELRVAHGDVSGDAFTKTKATKDAKSGSKATLAMQALFFNGGLRRQVFETNRGDIFRSQDDAVD